MRLAELAFVVVAAAAVRPQPAAACSLATNDPWRADPAHAADRVAPGQPDVAAAEVQRQAESGGCGMAGCGNIASIRVDVTATDDRAAAEVIGYEVTVVGGEPPAGLDLAREGRVVAPGGELRFFFDYSAPGFSVDLELRAVDLNGNVGAPVVVTVTDRDDGDGGCMAARTHGLVGCGLVLLALGWVTRRRYRC